MQKNEYGFFTNLELLATYICQQFNGGIEY
jgi:hypothetical protein